MSHIPVPQTVPHKQTLTLILSLFLSGWGGGGVNSLWWFVFFMRSIFACPTATGSREKDFSVVYPLRSRLIIKVAYINSRSPSSSQNLKYNFIQCYIFFFLLHKALLPAQPTLEKTGLPWTEQPSEGWYYKHSLGLHSSWEGWTAVDSKTSPAAILGWGITGRRGWNNCYRFYWQWLSTD